ncbi:MAG TPA: DUF4397 domain-containing protein [Mucilaginibacter sp.]
MNIRLLVLLGIILVAGLASCKKNNDAPVVKQIDSLNIVNASADTINFYLNGTRLNASNILPAGATGYYQISSGDQVYQVKKPFNPATNVVQNIFSLPLTLEPHHFYSLFIAGETAAQTFITPDVLMEDDSTGTCLVRFVNASPDAGNLDFVVNGTKIPNQAFKTASGFVLVPVSDTPVPVMVYHAGSTTPIISGTYTLTTGTFFTFFSEGTLTGTGNKAFGIGAFQF